MKGQVQPFGQRSGRRLLQKTPFVYQTRHRSEDLWYKTRKRAVQDVRLSVTVLLLVACKGTKTLDLVGSAVCR